jgi:hypothetical protein
MRSAEMLLAWTRGLIPNAKREEFDRQGHFGKLLEGRKLWGIFQHHDGMTGTARKHVVVVSFMAFQSYQRCSYMSCRTTATCCILLSGMPRR